VEFNRKVRSGISNLDYIHLEWRLDSSTRRNPFPLAGIYEASWLIIAHAKNVTGETWLESSKN
jgi:hypothetical protein